MQRCYFGIRRFRWVIILVWPWLCPSISAQDASRRTIRVSLEDRTIEARVLNKHKELQPKQDRDYFWCIGQRIMATQGGMSGDLLDGPYTEYHPNGQLRTQGRLSKGLRVGTWNEWDENGRLLRSTGWKQGRKHGPSVVMDLAGGEPTKQRYRHGKLVGSKKKQAADREKTQSHSGPVEEKPIAKKKEKPPKEVKDKGMSKRMRKREEQNKGTKEEVHKRKKDKDEGKKEEPVPPKAP